MATVKDMERPLGCPAHLRDDDKVRFRLGSGQDLEAGKSVRKVDLFHLWQVANFRYKRGGPMVVKDVRGKDSYRTWRVEPVGQGDLWMVVLHPLHEDSFFRGDVAEATEPFILSSAFFPLFEHLSSQERFDRVSAAVGSKKGWGDVSRWFALLHNYGFIRASGEPAEYGRDSEILGKLKGKDLELGLGKKTRYEKTEAWAASLDQQISDLKSSGEKTAEVAFG